MTKAVTHLSNIRRFADRTITGTLCNRMTGGEINCTSDAAEVTCKLCLREMNYRSKRADRPLTTNQMVAMFAAVLAA